MIVSPWTSTVLRQSQPLLKNILSELAMAKVEGGVTRVDDHVIFVNPLALRVPSFISPLTSVEYAERKLYNEGEVIMDARSFMRVERRSDDGYVTNNQLQSDFYRRIATLTSLWVAEPGYREDFMRVGQIAAMTYIAWIGQTIGYKLGLDLEASREVQILTALFYIHQHVDADTALDSKEKEKHLHMILRWTRAPEDLIRAIIEPAPYMMLIEDYVNYLHQHFEHNTRIKQINTGFLVMSLGRSWFGYGAHELAALAVEYPPVYLALVEAACNSKVWKKTQLGRLVERFARNNADKVFLKSMEQLARSAG